MAASDIEGLFRWLRSTASGGDTTSPFVPGQPLYIYGAGNVGKDVLGVFHAKGITVSAFLDRKANQRSTWEDVPILAVDDPAILAEDRRRAHVAIAIFNRETEMAPIVELLTRHGYGRITPFVDLHDRFPHELGDRFWLTARSFYLEHAGAIASGYEIWCDETSRETYTAILEHRFGRSIDGPPRPSFKDQYFPEGLPAWSSPMRFVDCGAYDGDTLRVLMSRGEEVEAIAAFEPDPLNFPKLAKSARSWTAAVKETISLFPCGVGGETAQIRFSSGRGSSSSASEHGDTMVQGVALDDALPGFRPSLIKMDIEGGEYDALLGARKMIEVCRPGLAISVYHRADHLWTVPLLVHSWLKGGRHYLRSHAYNGFELVYYWMP